MAKIKDVRRYATLMGSIESIFWWKRVQARCSRLERRKRFGTRGGVGVLQGTEEPAVEMSRGWKGLEEAVEFVEWWPLGEVMVDVVVKRWGAGEREEPLRGSLSSVEGAGEGQGWVWGLGAVADWRTGVMDGVGVEGGEWPADISAVTCTSVVTVP